MIQVRYFMARVLHALDAVTLYFSPPADTAVTISDVELEYLLKVMELNIFIVKKRSHFEISR